MFSNSCSSSILWYLSNSFQPKKKAQTHQSSVEVMIPAVLGVCFLWLITLTILTRHRLSLNSEAFREPVLLFGEQETPLHHCLYQEGKQECLGHFVLHWIGVKGALGSVLGVWVVKATAVPARQWDRADWGTEDIPWTVKIVLVLVCGYKCCVGDWTKTSGQSSYCSAQLCSLLVYLLVK